MFEENILENNFEEDLLTDDSLFEDDEENFLNEEDEDGVDFDSYDDPSADW